MDDQTFEQLYRESMDDFEGFWADQAHRLDWLSGWDTVYSGNFAEGTAKWFAGGKLNACVNCVDRHLEHHADKKALVWVGDEPGQEQVITFAELYDRVCRMANLLKAHQVGKGDRVCIYLPMIPEAVVAMLACARIGAVHSVIFAGFSPKSIASRIADADCRCVITADMGYRGGKAIPCKANVDAALEQVSGVDTVLVVRHTGVNIDWHQDRDVDYQQAVLEQPPHCLPEPMDAEDPLFILYTSGSTGKPKGILHSTAGYLLYSNLSFASVFDIKDDDVYWCTADVGWITGHSYIVYGPLAQATTSVIFEGKPTYPDASRFWRIVDHYQVSVFYTAPTAIRLLMSYGEASLADTDRSSLRVLGTVGEPINPEAWQWYYHQVGSGRCPIMDTWWQTETGGFMLAPPLDQHKQKPGVAMRPFLGVEPALLDDKGQEIIGSGEGALVIKRPWPGMMRTVYGDHQRFLTTYMRPAAGYYYTGDAAYRDEDGDIAVTGRMDDVLNVAGHRLGTAELESALVEHQAVAEAAVVGLAGGVKGVKIYAYVVTSEPIASEDSLKQELNRLVRQEIGAIASIDYYQWAHEVPKTRSGKIMRRILRKIASGDYDDLGDVSTLANPECIEELICEHRKQNL